MTITDKYLKLKKENERLKKMLSFVCTQFENGETENLESDVMLELWAWWENKKKMDKKREMSKCNKLTA